MPARRVCLVPLSLSEAGPRRFGRQVSVIDIYHTTIPYLRSAPLFSARLLPTMSRGHVPNDRDLVAGLGLFL